MDGAKHYIFFRRVLNSLWVAIFALILFSGGCSGDGQPEGELVSVDAMYEHYARSFPKVKSVTTAELSGWIESGEAVVVDVREPYEREVSMIPGSVTVEEYESGRDEFAGKKVVAYCTIGYRSGKYADELRKDGVEVYNLEGSLLAWVRDGGKIVDPKGKETKTVHVYGPTWNKLPPGYEAVW